MTDRVPMTVRVDEELKDEFTQFVENVYGGKRGAKADAVEDALRQLMETDRDAELHGRFDSLEESMSEVLTHLSENEPSHTHTPPEGIDERRSETYTTVENIAEELKNVYDTVIQDRDVEIEIKKIGGGHDETVRRYRCFLKEFAFLYEHPGEPPLWTTDEEMFFRWLTGVPNADDDVLREYKGTVADAYDEWRDGQMREQSGETAVADGGANS